MSSHGPSGVIDATATYLNAIGSLPSSDRGEKAPAISNLMTLLKISICDRILGVSTQGPSLKADVPDSHS